MRRLGLLGLGSAAATALLAGPVADAGAHGSHGGHRGGGHADGTVVEWAPVATEPITFPGPNGTLMAAFAAAADPVGGVLVIHENRGLTDHIRVVAGRFAAAGYSALAIDLLSEEGGTAAIGDEAQVAAILASVPPERFDADMKAGVTELARRLPGKGLAAIGFCFGGGMVWRLLAAGERRLSAAAPFYGPFPEGGDLSNAKAAVLAVYGGLDARVGATRPAAQAAIAAAGLKSRILIFTEADHAFFNDTGPRFNAPAAAEAYRQTLRWFEKFVAGGKSHHRRG
jgi:carboxymethylenebutenolidase